MKRVEFSEDCSIEYLELEDMPPCRACGVMPEIKGNQNMNGCGNTRLQCPKCGIRTGQSTNEQAKYIVWKKVMGGAQ